MSEVIVHQPQHVMDLEQQMSYSKALAAASIIPKAYQNQPANILVAIGYAQALGEHPIAALTDVYIVNGRPSMSAAMMHRRAIEAGHRVRVSATEEEATASIWRKDDPSFEHRVTWTLDRAKASGLTKNPVWKTFSSAMLRARAISEACRLACPEVLGAAKYLPDEIGGAFADGPPSAPAAAPGPTTKVSRKKKEAEPVDAEVIDEPTSTEDPGAGDNPRPAAEQAPSEQAFKRMFAILGENGLTGRDEALGYVSSIVGREIASRSELNAQEVAKVADSFTPTPEEN